MDIENLKTFDKKHGKEKLRGPRPDELLLPEFERVWQAIKGWDIEDFPGDGYHGTTGNNVIAILDALGITKPE